MRDLDHYLGENEPKQSVIKTKTERDQEEALYAEALQQALDHVVPAGIAGFNRLQERAGGRVRKPSNE